MSLPFEVLVLIVGALLVLVAVFAVGILLVPSLTNAIFTGRGGESVLPHQLKP